VRDVNLILKVLTALPPITLLGVFAATNDVPSAVLCAVGVASTCILTLPVLFTRPLDVFHPFSLLILSVFLGTGGKAFYLVFSRSPRRFLLTDGETAGSFLVGALLILGGCLCITIGYFAAGKYQIPIEKVGQLRKQLSTPRLLIFAVLTIPVATLATMDFLQRTGFERDDSLSAMSRKRSVVVADGAMQGQQTTALGYHRLVAGTLPAAVCIALTIGLCSQSVTSPSKAGWWLAGLCFCTACFLPFLASSRKNIIFLLLDVLIVFNYTNRLRKHHLVLGFAAACSIGILMLAIRANSGNGFFENSSNMADRVADGLFGTTNYLEITKTSAMHRSVPEVLDYRYGMTYAGVLYIPVPRLLYPEKPAVRPGPEFADKVYGYSRQTGGSIPPGFIGETIWNFSVWSVLPASLLYGAILRILYNSFVPFMRNSSTALMIYVALLLPMSFEFLGGAVSGSILNIAQRAVFALMFILLASEWPRQQRTMAVN